MICFDTNTVRIFKQNRIVAWRESILLWSVDNIRANLNRNIMDFVHIFPAARAKTKMMQARVSLLEALIIISSFRTRNVDTGSATYAIDAVRGIVDQR